MLFLFFLFFPLLSCWMQIALAHIQTMPTISWCKISKKVEEQFRNTEIILKQRSPVYNLLIT